VTQVRGKRRWSSGIGKPGKGTADIKVTSDNDDGMRLQNWAYLKKRWLAGLSTKRFLSRERGRAKNGVRPLLGNLHSPLERNSRFVNDPSCGGKATLFSRTLKDHFHEPSRQNLVAVRVGKRV